jgi:hypothetical protein
MQRVPSLARLVAVVTFVMTAMWLVVPAVMPDPPTIPFAEAASCKGGAHTLTVKALPASPTSGSPSTTILFEAVVQDSGGCTPSSVLVIVGGVRQATMTGTGGSITTGRTYQATMQLPSGTWSYAYRATSGTGGGLKTETVAGPGTITILAATPTPVPTPVPTPRPTPVPTPRPTPGPTPRPTPGATPDPTPRPTARPTPPPTSPGTPPASASTSHGPSPTSRSSAGSSPATLPLGVVLTGGQPPDDRGDDGPRGVGVPPDNGGDGRSFFDVGAVLANPSLLPVVAWASTTSIGILVFALVFGRHGLVAPATLGFLVGGDVRRRAPARAPRTAEPELGGGPAADVAEAAPQRPGPTRWTPTSRPPLRFETPAPRGVERRTIGYREVRVSAGADDLRTREVGRLDRGDEVELIGEDGGSLHVRTPNGLEGWVPRIVMLGAPTREP